MLGLPSPVVAAIGPLFDKSKAGIAVVANADAGFAAGAGAGLGGGGGAGAGRGAAAGAGLGGGGAAGRGGGGRGRTSTSETWTVASEALGSPGAITPPVDSPASTRLGDGIFLRIASVSISNPVVNTSSSSDAGSSLPTSSCTASTYTVAATLSLITIGIRIAFLEPLTPRRVERLLPSQMTTCS